MIGDIARILELPEGDKVQKAVRLRSYKGQPFSLATTFAPERIGRTFTKAELAKQRLLTLLIRASGSVASAHQRLTARAADPQVATLLKVEYGSPLICITRVVRDAEGRPINHVRALYRPERYEFPLDLSTDSTPDGAVWRPSPQQADDTQ
jgi:GntR family transcriptional regulator